MTTSEKSNIFITGATEFIGKSLCNKLIKKKYPVRIVTRNPEKAAKLFGSQIQTTDWNNLNINGCGTVINLAGENIGNGRWTKEKKEKILNSRLKSIKNLANSIEKTKSKPRTFIQASAIGIYGDGKDKILDEQSPPGNEFLSEVVSKVEKALNQIKAYNIRTVAIRSAVVLGNNGGALEQIIKPFNLGAGGIVGTGKEFLSWIHLDDEVRAIIYLLENEELSRAFNLSSPNPLRSVDFYKTIGRVLNKPRWSRLPPAVVKLLTGQKGKELLLSSKRVHPKRLLESDFQFKYETLESALKEIFSSSEEKR